MQLLGGDVRFVLSTSGHIQALVNPPGPESKSQLPRVGDAARRRPTSSSASVPTSGGSWWPDYAAWLAERSGPRRKARKTLGNAKHKPLAEAPGEYVLAA